MFVRWRGEIVEETPVLQLMLSNPPKAESRRAIENADFAESPPITAAFLIPDTVYETQEQAELAEGNQSLKGFLVLAPIL